MYRTSTSSVIGNLILVGNHGRVEYKCPVCYNDSKRQCITCYVQVYKNVSNDDNIRCCEFEPASVELKAFPFTDVMTHANLSTQHSSARTEWNREGCSWIASGNTANTACRLKGIKGHKKFLSKSVSHWWGNLQNNSCSWPTSWIGSKRRKAFLPWV